MPKAILLITLLYISHFTIAQQQYQQSYALDQEVKLCCSDKLQNCYIADENGTIQKFNPDGQLAFEYSNNTLGEVGVLDATDPFNIALFYPDYLNVVFLDRTLTETQRITLLDANIFEAQTIGLSTENKIWVYDSYDFRLKKINQQANITHRSDDLSLLLQASIQTLQIQEYENKVYLNAPELGILVFDSFANYLTRLDFKGVRHFQVLQNQLIFWADEGLQSYHLQAKLTRPIPLPEGVSSIKYFQVQKNRLYLHTEKGISVYMFE